MAFDVPDEADAAFVPQARLFSTDLNIVTLGSGLTGVVSGCAVTAQGSPDMTVAVAAGVVLVAGAVKAVTSGNVTIAAADATNPRIDVVVADSTGAKQRRGGTAAASPRPPTLTSGDVALAMVYVPANDTAINSNQIIDKRVPLPTVYATDTITELTAAAGVTVDGVVLKDGGVNALGALFGGDGGGTIYLQHAGVGNEGMLVIEDAANGAKLTFYSDAGSGDVNLYRAGANTLKTDDDFGSAGYLTAFAGDSGNEVLLGNVGGTATVRLGGDVSIYRGNADILQTDDLLLLAAGSTSRASLRVPHGSAPTTPTNGDIWTTTSGLFVRVNGTTVGPLT